MDNPSAQQPPDLATILRTLSQYQKPAVAQEETSQAMAGAPATVSHASNTEDHEEYDPTQFNPVAVESTAQHSSQTNQPAQPSSHSNQLSHASQSSDTSRTAASTSKSTPAAPAPSSRDASQITTWAPALRYVTSLVARDAKLLPHLRKLQTSQRDHETQWWQGRQALLKTQSERSAGRAQIEAILKGVGGTVDSSVQGPSADDDAREVADYERKVYRAAIMMEKSFKKDLDGMGIPFFCTDAALVSSDDKKTTTTAVISQEELQALQLRMLETLEDLSGE